MRLTAVLIAALAALFASGCGKQPAPVQGRGGLEDAADVARDAADGASSDRVDAADAAEPGTAASGGAGSASSSGAGDTVFAPLLDDVERARGVQQTVDEQAERLRKEIEKAEGAAP
jgi:hypothetical protein